MAIRICALTAILCVVATGDVARAGEPRVKVLALHFAMRNAPSIAAVDKALRDALGQALGDRVDYESEYVDTAGFADVAYQSTFRGYLQARYGKTPPDIVIGTTQAVVPFLNQSPAIFEGVPVAYVSRASVPALAHAAGIISGFDFGGTLDAILQVQPETREVYVIAGSSPPERNYVEWLREHRKPYADRLTFHELIGLPLSELRDKIQTLPTRSVIYYLSVFEDREGRPYAATDALDVISAAANVPVYSWHAGFFGHGIVGGVLHSSVNDARELARVALRMLNGEAPDTITPVRVDSRIVEFDDRQLRRWQLATTRLPAGSLIGFRQPSFFELYRKYVAVGALVFTAQVTLIVGLVLQRMKRRRVEAALAQATARNSAILRAVPDLMFVLDRKGTYVDYHARDQSLLFAPPEFFLGRTIPEIFPAPISERFMAALSQVSATGDPLVVEYELDIGGMRHYEARHVPLHDNLVLCIVREVTEAHRALELNRTLTGRLITSQEDERRRIARELHDDVAQRLALLAVDLGVLNREADEQPTDVHPRLHALARHAAALGSDLQRVSHELHPAILEQLGLEMAVRGACHDLSNLRQIVIDAQIPPLPSRLTPTVALCFYRIVQEALQNVARHSHASHVTVHLATSDGELCLKIVDDGVGFDVASATHGRSLGLTSMRERIRLIGGRLTVLSRLGEGTSIEATAPLSGD